MAPLEAEVAKTTQDWDASVAMAEQMLLEVQYVP